MASSISNASTSAGSTTNTVPSRPPFLSSGNRSSSTSRLLSQRASQAVKLSLLQLDPSSSSSIDSGASTAPSGPSFQASLNEMVQTTTGLMTAATASAAAGAEGGAFSSALEDLQMWQKEGAAQQQPQGEDKQMESHAQQQTAEKIPK